MTLLGKTGDGVSKNLSGHLAHSRRPRTRPPPQFQATTSAGGASSTERTLALNDVTAEILFFWQRKLYICSQLYRREL